jgi:hypothetical protein
VQITDFWIQLNPKDSNYCLYDVPLPFLRDPNLICLVHLVFLVCLVCLVLASNLYLPTFNTFTPSLGANGKVRETLVWLDGFLQDIRIFRRAGGKKDGLIRSSMTRSVPCRAGKGTSVSQTPWAILIALISSRQSTMHEFRTGRCDVLTYWGKETKHYKGRSFCRHNLLKIVRRNWLGSSIFSCTTS